MEVEACDGQVKETASGKFFISLTFDVDIEPIETRKKFDRIEAFDYSMPSLAVSASGENDITKDDIRWYRNLEERIAKEQRRLEVRLCQLLAAETQDREATREGSKQEE